MFLDGFSWSVLVRVGTCYYIIYSCEHCGHSNDSEKIQTIILVIRKGLEIDFKSFEAVLVGPCSLVLEAFFLN